MTLCDGLGLGPALVAGVPSAGPSTSGSFAPPLLPDAALYSGIGPLAGGHVVLARVVLGLSRLTEAQPSGSSAAALASKGPPPRCGAFENAMIRKEAVRMLEINVVSLIMPAWGFVGVWLVLRRDARLHNGDPALMCKGCKARRQSMEEDRFGLALLGAVGLAGLVCLKYLEAWEALVPAGIRRRLGSEVPPRCVGPSCSAHRHHTVARLAQRA